jgi:hypothetical protein
MDPTHGLYKPNLPIPSGWRRVCIGEQIQAGDLWTLHTNRQTSMRDGWEPVLSGLYGNKVNKNNVPIIRNEQSQGTWEFKPDAPIPEGWYRLPLGTVFESGDRFHWAGHHGGDSTPPSRGEDWMKVGEFWVGKETVGKETAIVIRKKPVKEPAQEASKGKIPEGWYRLEIGTLLVEGDKFTHWTPPGDIRDWNPVRDHELKKNTRVVAGGATCIRPIQNEAETSNSAVPANNIVKKEENKTMSKINTSTLTALLALRQGEATETMPGCDGEGVFAQAFKDAEAKRRETALNALTEVAIVIQDTFAAAKETQRSEIRHAQTRIDAAKKRLNELDAAAEPLKGATPNPFPLLHQLGMVDRHSLGLSVEEFTKLVTVPSQK